MIHIVGSVLVRKIPKTLFDFFVNRKFSSDRALKFFQKLFSARWTKLWIWNFYRTLKKNFSTLTSSKQNVGDEKTDFRRRSQVQILLIHCINKSAWRWSFPTPSFCIVKNINRCAYRFRIYDFEKSQLPKKSVGQLLKNFQFRWQSERTDFHFRYPWQFSHWDFSKIFFHKNFLEFDFSMNGFLQKLFFSQERRNHKLKKSSRCIFPKFTIF